MRDNNELGLDHMLGGMNLNDPPPPAAPDESFDNIESEHRRIISIYSEALKDDLSAPVVSPRFVNMITVSMDRYWNLLTMQINLTRQNVRETELLYEQLKAALPPPPNGVSYLEAYPADFTALCSALEDQRQLLRIIESVHGEMRLIRLRMAAIVGGPGQEV